MKKILFMAFFIFIVIFSLSKEVLARDFKPNFRNLCTQGSVQEFKAIFQDIPVNGGLDDNGRTPLMCAAIWGMPKVITLLKDIGANLEIKDKNGLTALMYAASSEKQEGLDGLELLLKYGANINATDKDGMTALMYAASNGNVKALEILLGYGASVNLKDKNNNTALFYPLQDYMTDSDLKDPQALGILLRYGIDVNSQNDNGETALIYAVKILTPSNIMHGFGPLPPQIFMYISILLENGADPNLRDKSGKRAIDYARKNNNNGNTDDIIEILMKAMKLDKIM